MKMKRCPVGHFYDPDMYETCPWCEQNPAAMMGGGMPNRGPEAFAQGAPMEEEKNESPLAAVRQAPAEETRLVSGWLVCEEGPLRGRVETLYLGQNFLGEKGGPPLGKAPLRIVYEGKRGQFWCSFLGGRDPLWVNGTMMLSTVELSARDRLRLGTNRFVFVPLCGEDFSWT